MEVRRRIGQRRRKWEGRTKLKMWMKNREERKENGGKMKRGKDKLSKGTGK